MLLGLLASPAARAQQTAAVSLAKTGFVAADMALVINENDPLSLEIGAYYQKVRQIPAANVVRVRFPAGVSAISREEFARVKREVDAQLPGSVLGYALAWAAPYRVECMSITSAFAFGFDAAYCSNSCGSTRASPYFNSPSLDPLRDHGLRPAMLLAARSPRQARALIDRGRAADATMPQGTAYLLRTSDKARSSRAGLFEATARQLAAVFRIAVLDADWINDYQDVLFYFTGKSQVVGLETLRFVPGALADHLTSAGGMLTDSGQMSALDWLEAGATASYGTVVEPCNHPQKFPAPAVAMFHYAAGASAIEAYWKSVAWPGEGVFIGDPLAKPFAWSIKTLGPGVVQVRVFSPVMRQLVVEAAGSPMGPFKALPQQLLVRPGRGAAQIRLPDPASGSRYFRIR